MNRNTLLIDAAIAAVLTILVVVLSPGLAVVGLIALVVVLVCAISFAFDLRRRRGPKVRERQLREVRRDRRAAGRQTPERQRRSAR
jgi:ABC-type bacteriocin/lantibiotic exporter with double-glycine peptidase domain